MKTHATIGKESLIAQTIVIVNNPKMAAQKDARLSFAASVN